MQGWQQWTVSERCSFFHPLLLPPSHEYIYHIYPCGFYFSLAWGWVAPNPKNLYLIRNFPELSYAVSFDQWALCRGPMTSQRTSKVPGCSAGLVNGSAVDWNIPAPANVKESEDMHRELVKEKIVQTKQNFQYNLKKSRNLSIPSQSASVWDRPPVTQDMIPQPMMESRSLEYSIKEKKRNKRKE